MRCPVFLTSFEKMESISFPTHLPKIVHVGGVTGVTGKVCTPQLRIIPKRWQIVSLCSSLDFGGLKWTIRPSYCSTCPCNAAGKGASSPSLPSWTHGVSFIYTSFFKPLWKSFSFLVWENITIQVNNHIFLSFRSESCLVVFFPIFFFCL